MKRVVLISRGLLFIIAAILYTWLFFNFIIPFLQLDTEDYLFDLQEDYGPLGGIIIMIGLSWWLSRTIVSITTFKNIAKWVLTVFVWLGTINLFVGIWFGPFEILKMKWESAIILTIYGIITALFSTIGVHTKTDKT